MTCLSEEHAPKRNNLVRIAKSNRECERKSVGKLSETTRRFDLNFRVTGMSNVPSMSARTVPPAVLLTLTTLLASCSKSEIQTYRVAKDPAPAGEKAAAAHAHASAGPAAPAAPNTPPAATPNAGGNAMANTPVATASGPGLTWSAPSHWKAKPASAMRKVSFTVIGDGGEADLSITAFPGDVGGDLANLNRWRGQINLPPIQPSDFETAVQRLEKNGLRMTVVDIAGEGAGAQRILGAMIPLGGSTWFVKLGPGPAGLIAKEKPAFLAFLDTVKSAAAAQ